MPHHRIAALAQARSALRVVEHLFASLAFCLRNAAKAAWSDGSIGTSSRSQAQSFVCNRVFAAQAYVALPHGLSHLSFFRPPSFPQSVKFKPSQVINQIHQPLFYIYCIFSYSLLKYTQLIRNSSCSLILFSFVFAPITRLHRPTCFSGLLWPPAPSL